MKDRVVPLGLLGEGERGVIVDLGGIKVEHDFHRACHGSCEGCGDGDRRRVRRQRGQMQRVRNMGLKTGKMVEVLKNQKGQPLLVQVENSLLALSRGLAMKILVEPLGRGV